jgi:hypothetical protein
MSDKQKKNNNRPEFTEEDMLNAFKHGEAFLPQHRPGKGDGDFSTFPIRHWPFWEWLNLYRKNKERENEESN